MSLSVTKVDVTCPHCGATQKEPPRTVSTFCRSCSGHFEIAARQQPASARPKGPQRDVHCYRCDADHTVSRSARSTLCPTCNAGIELCDMDFSANASRPVDIRGKLRVRKGAHLNNSLIICTDARIEGQVTGTLLCEHQLELLGSGKLSFKATAETTLVGHKATMELTYPLKTKTLEVNGCLTGQIVCTGTVRIHKGGILRGSLEARSLAVDRGGICEAFTKIVSSPAAS